MTTATTTHQVHCHNYREARRFAERVSMTWSPERVQVEHNAPSGLVVVTVPANSTFDFSDSLEVYSVEVS